MELKTPLYDAHVKAGGKMVPFAGYILPVQYGTGVNKEHLAVRTAVGMFDVSHMGEILCEGPDALANLNRILTNDFTSMVLEQARLLADSGYCVILSTHTPQHSLWYADMALALQDGNIAAFGDPADVLNEKLIEDLYGVKTNFIETDNGVIISPGSKIYRKTR